MNTFDQKTMQFATRRSAIGLIAGLGAAIMTTAKAGATDDGDDTTVICQPDCQTRCVNKYRCKQKCRNGGKKRGRRCVNKCRKAVNRCAREQCNCNIDIN